MYQSIKNYGKMLIVKDYVCAVHFNNIIKYECIKHLIKVDEKVIVKLERTTPVLRKKVYNFSRYFTFVNKINKKPA